MNVAFADTFFWIAFTNTQDQAHEIAKNFAQSTAFDTTFTTEEVLTEYLNYFAGWARAFAKKPPRMSRASLPIQPCRLGRNHPNGFRPV